LVYKMVMETRLQKQTLSYTRLVLICLFTLDKAKWLKFCVIECSCFVCTFLDLIHYLKTSLRNIQFCSKSWKYKRPNEKPFQLCVCVVFFLYNFLFPKIWNISTDWHFGYIYSIYFNLARDSVRWGEMSEQFLSTEI
jgi:hypothetical protein